MTTSKSGPVRADSAAYSQPFYGILNAQGYFWTPLAFDSEAKARQHIVDFWGRDHESRDRCLHTHRIVPVRVQLTTIEDPDA